jgi:hypothetical protein
MLAPIVLAVLTATACFEDPLTLDRELLAKAEPDECFVAVGAPYPDGPFCPEGSQPKVNPGYVFGLTESRDRLWFGTSANQLCTVLGSVLEYLGDVAPDLTLETDAFVCEFGRSHYRSVFVPPPSSDLAELPPSLGDWRPPQVFSHDLTTGELVERTPDDELIEDTLGLRSAGSLGDLVLLGGPDLQAGFVAQGGSINLFAFDGATGAYLGSRSVPEYLDIRKWLAVDGVLYTAVKTRDGGRVLRWTGTVDDPFQWEEVGVLDAEGAELALHDGRLFVTTWWNELGAQMAGLWMSPELGSEGLSASDAGLWEKVWAADDYEPDEAIAYSYFGGALHSYGGDLYWGTINFPLVSLGAHVLLRGLDVAQDLPEILAALLPSHRTISIHRGRHFDHPRRKKIEVLYGERELFAWENGRWALQRNATGPPRYGHSGFGNLFNAYTWTMGVYDGQLYVGTFDWSFLVGRVARLLAEALGVPRDEILDRLPFAATVGADLWRFPNRRSPAIPESLGGVGNNANYGIRTMLAREEALYLGTANPMNLLTDPADALPEGGWELLALSGRAKGRFPVLAPGVGPPQPSGSTIHWVAFDPRATAYRFSVQVPSGAERVLRDFDASPTLEWQPLEEGLHRVIVTVRSASGSESSGSAWFMVEPPVTSRGPGPSGHEGDAQGT